MARLDVPIGGLDLRLHVTREAPETWRGERGRITLDATQPAHRRPSDAVLRLRSRKRWSRTSRGC